MYKTLRGWMVKLAVERLLTTFVSAGIIHDFILQQEQQHIDIVVKKEADSPFQFTSLPI